LLSANACDENIMPSSSKLLFGWAIIALALIGVLGCADNDGRSSKVRVRPTSAIDAKAIRLVDLDGQPFDLWQTGGNKVTVAVFTRTDCPISNRYAPDLRQLYESVHPRGVEFYLIYVDPKEAGESIRAHLKEYEYPCPALRDPEHTLAAATGATVTPEAVVFNREKNLVYRGRIDDRNVSLGNSGSVAAKRDLADAIEATLAGESVTEPETKAVGCYIGDL
jgi:peroxiredoxin